MVYLLYHNHSPPGSRSTNYHILLRKASVLIKLTSGFAERYRGHLNQTSRVHQDRMASSPLFSASLTSSMITDDQQQEMNHRPHSSPIWPVLRFQYHVAFTMHQRPLRQRGPITYRLYSPPSIVVYPPEKTRVENGVLHQIFSIPSWPSSPVQSTIMPEH